MTERVVDGVRIVEDGDVTRFVPVDEPEGGTEEQGQETERGLFGAVKGWWDSLWAKPYVKVRDLADPFGDRDDPDKGRDGRSWVEVGLRIDF